MLINIKQQIYNILNKTQLEEIKLNFDPKIIVENIYGVAQ